eukprot:1161591-Pelagomonas_calceolata.AAC.2
MLPRCQMLEEEQALTNCLHACQCVENSVLAADERREELIGQLIDDSSPVAQDAKGELTNWAARIGERPSNVILKLVYAEGSSKTQNSRHVQQPSESACGFYTCDATPCMPLQAGWLLHTPGDLPVDQLNAEHIMQLLSTVPDAAQVLPSNALVIFDEPLST